MAYERAVLRPERYVGAPDGPWEDHPEFELQVPTYVDPRKDLIYDKKAIDVKRLTYHVPGRFRGPYRVVDFPDAYAKKYGKGMRTDTQGFVLCGGTRKDGERCTKRAMNMCGYCPNHGGALHPCDKSLSNLTNLPAGAIDPDRIHEMDRVAKFMAGFLKPSDLDDDEVVGAFVRNDEGRKIHTSAMSNKFHSMMVKELFNRVNSFMQMKLPNMIKVLSDIAESDYAEPADRIKAANLIIERTMGKTPDIVVHGTTDKPFESIMARIEGGSRDAHRVASSRGNAVNGQVIDAEIVYDELEPDISPDGIETHNGASRSEDSGSVGVRNEFRPGKDLVSQRDSDANASRTGTAELAQRRTDAAQGRKAFQDRIKRARNKRFAQRAQGNLSSNDVAWMLEYKPLRKDDGGFGIVSGFKVKLIAPEHQTPARLDKMAMNNIIADWQGEHHGTDQGHSGSGTQDDQAVHGSGQDASDSDQ